MAVSDAALGQLIAAIQERDVSKVRLHWDAVQVTDEACLTAAGTEGLTALGYACKLGAVEVALALLEHPLVDPNAAKRITTNLMLAAGRGYDEIVKALLAHPRIDANRKRRDGVTALLLSVQLDHVETTRVLLRHPRLHPSIKALFPERMTPLVVAIRQQLVRQVALLLQSDRMLSSDNVWMRETPLEYARSFLKEHVGDSLGVEHLKAAPHSEHAAQTIADLLAEFESGGCDAVARLVAPCDRLLGGVEDASTNKGFGHELSLCTELLQLQLSPEAMAKVYELMTALRTRGQI